MPRQRNPWIGITLATIVVVVLCALMVLIPLAPADRSADSSDPITSINLERIDDPDETLQEMIAYLQSRDQPVTAKEVDERYVVQENDASAEYVAAVALMVYPTDDDSDDSHSMADLSDADADSGVLIFNFSDLVTAEVEKSRLNTLPFVGYNSRIDRITDALPPDMGELVREHIELNAPALNALRAIDPDSPCRWPADYSEGFRVLIPHLGQLRSFARLLKLDTFLALHENDIARAYSNQLELLKLADSLRDEPMIISQLVRFACYALALANIEELVNVHPPDAETAESFINHLEGIELYSGLTQCFANERAIVLSDPDLATAEQLTKNLPASVDFVSLGKIVEIKATEQYIQRLNAGVFNPEPLRDFYEQLPEQYMLGTIQVPALAAAIDTTNNAYSDIKTTMVGLACHQYKLDHGSYPTVLSQLVPEYLNEIPVDVFTGKPLHYIDAGVHGIVVYATGADQQDNQGRAFQHSDYRTLGRKPDSDDSEDFVYTDIVFTLGDYQQAKFSEPQED